MYYYIGCWILPLMTVGANRVQVGVAGPGSAFMDAHDKPKFHRFLNRASVRPWQRTRMEWGNRHSCHRTLSESPAAILGSKLGGAPNPS